MDRSILSARLFRLAACLAVVLLMVGAGPEEAATQLKPAEKLPPLKVGITISQYGAMGPSWLGHPYRFGQAKFMLYALRHEPSIQLIPVIDPGSAKEEETAAMLEEFFPRVPPMDATDMQALKQLDVLVVVNSANIKPECLDAYEGAVTNGTHLMFTWMGGVTPGDTEQVSRLSGLENSRYGWNPKAVQCVVAEEHPLLGDLKKGAKLSIVPNGRFGVLKAGKALVEVVDEDKSKVVGDDAPEGATFAPLYVSELGKGKILGVSWYVHVDAPPDISDAVGGRFYARAVNWLCGRTLEK